MNHEKKKLINRRRLIQWMLAPIIIIIMVLGWKYTFLGFAVPVLMLMGLIGGFFKGRYVCGNLCPRGSFFDRIVSTFSFKKDIPPSLRKMPFRLLLFAILMVFMAYILARDITNINHWGYTFWEVCVLTTAAGLIIGIVIHPRSWCAFCPMGTLQNVIGGHKSPLQIDKSKCISCRICENICPMSLHIVDDKDKGELQSRDCLKCGECVAACPKNVLSWKKEKEGIKKDEDPA